MTYHTLIAFALLLLLPECTQPDPVKELPPVPPCGEVWCEHIEPIIDKPE